MTLTSRPRGNTTLSGCAWTLNSLSLSTTNTTTLAGDYSSTGGLYNDADGAIPFHNSNGLNYGTTDWVDEDIYPDFIILGTE